METRQNLAQANESDEWATRDLQHAILNAICILEMEIRYYQQTPQLPTASLLPTHTNSHHHRHMNGRQL